MCTLAELTTVDAAVVAEGLAVGGAVDAVVDVATGARVGAGVAVAAEPQATMNAKRMKIKTLRFRKVERFMTKPREIGTLSTF